MANLEQQVTKLMAEEIIHAIRKLTEENNHQYVNNQIKNYKMTSSNISSDLYARFADIAVLEAKTATIDTAQIENLYATVADFVYLAAQKAEFGDVEAQKIVTAVADMGIANIGSADIGWAQIKDLVSGSAIIREGINGKLFVDRLAVTEANMVSLTVGELIVKGSDGNFYSLIVGEDGNVSTELKQVSGDNIANNTISGGNLIENTITARELNVSKIFADEALIRAVKAANIDVDDLFANNAFVNSLTTYLIQDASFSSQIVMTNGAISAISKNINLQANDTFTSVVSSLNSSVEAAQQASNQNAEDLASAILKYDAEFEDLRGQLDGNILNWFYAGEPTLTNAPANEWTTEELKEQHIGDMYYDTDTNYAYRFLCVDGVYGWNRIADTDITAALQAAKNAQDTADSKRRIFFEQPTPPYDKGDVWTQGVNGHILRCQTAKTAVQTFSSSDWVLASKYTDDTVANAALGKANENQTLINGLTTRIVNAETKITQNDEQINLRATKAEVTELSNTVGENSGKLNQLDEYISEIDQKADAISISVSKKSTSYRQEDMPETGSPGDTWTQPSTGKQYQNTGAVGINAPGFAFDDNGDLLYAYEDDAQIEYTFSVDDSGDLILNAEGDYYIEDDGDFVGSGEWIEVVNQDFARLQVEVSGITATVGNMQGDISTAQQTANKIYWIVKSGDSASAMVLTDQFLKVVADDIDLSANHTMTFSAEQLEFLAKKLDLSLNNVIVQMGEDIGDAETDISGLQTRVTSAEGNISTATQTANKVNWLIQSGTSASNMTLTSQLISLMSKNITLTAAQINAVADSIVLTGNGAIINLGNQVSTAQSTADAAQLAANNAQSQADFATIYEGTMPPSAPIPKGKIWIDSSGDTPIMRRWLGLSVDPSNYSGWQTVTDLSEINDIQEQLTQNYETQNEAIQAIKTVLDVDTDGVHIHKPGYKNQNEVLIDQYSVNIKVGGEIYSSFIPQGAVFGNYRMWQPSEAGGLAFNLMT